MEYYFGSNWRTPIQQFNYNKTALAKLKEYIVQYIKAVLPPAVAEWWQRRTDAPKLQQWINKIYSGKK